MKRFALIFYALSLLLLTSCESLSQISIDYMMPGDFSFPTEIRRVGIVNNTYDVTKFTDSNSVKTIHRNKLSRTVFYSYGKGKKTTESLAKAMADQNYFDEVVICDSALRYNDIQPREQTLSREEINKLTKGLDVDAIIALENVEMKAVKEIRTQPKWDFFQGVIDVKIQPVVRVYVPTHDGPILTVNHNDSINWSEFGNSDKEVNDLLPSDTTMISQASDYAGTIPVKYLVPHWVSDARYYFSDGGSSTELRNATIFVRENNWNKAYAIWKRNYDQSKKPRRQMEMANNIALYYEMKDSIDQAIEWADKAHDLLLKINNGSTKNMNSNNHYYYQHIKTYLKELKHRQEKLPLLNLQMKRFSNDFK